MLKHAPEKSIPDESLHRLAMYHCLLSDWLLTGKKGTVTSKELGEALRIKETTVRQDLVHLGRPPGTRGIGYDISELRKVLGEFLSLPTFAPLAVVGSAQTINSLFNYIPFERLGFLAAAFFSEDPNDRGLVINGIEVKPIDALSPTLEVLGIKVAMVATSPQWVQYTLNQLAKAGIKSVLVLTQQILPEVPKGMHVEQVKITCELKTLFYAASLNEEQEAQ